MNHTHIVSEVVDIDGVRRAQCTTCDAILTGDDANTAHAVYLDDLYRVSLLDDEASPADKHMAGVVSSAADIRRDMPIREGVTDSDLFNAVQVCYLLRGLGNDGTIPSDVAQNAESAVISLVVAI